VSEDAGNACPWGGQQTYYRDYHDNRVGRPCVRGGVFERLSLEAVRAATVRGVSLQSGKNWRRAFAGSHREVARIYDADVQRLLADAWIVRKPGQGSRRRSPNAR